MQDSNYVVYVHKDAEGNVRYVGSGRLKRAKEAHPKSYRGIKYLEFVEEHGQLTPEIVCCGLTKDESLSLEISTYDKCVQLGFLLNKKRPHHFKGLPSVEHLNSILYYDETSFSCLRWKVKTSNNKCKKDSAAGFTNEDGYNIVKIDKKRYSAGRLILKMHGFEVGDHDVVDHLNGQRNDDRLCNIRVVTSAENSRNRARIQNTDKELPNGVSIHKGAVTARLVDPSAFTESGRNKELYKSFGIKRYGYDEALRLAIEARIQMVKDLEERLGVVYTERHGT